MHTLNTTSSVPHEVRLILIYGISGSGKTTLAREIVSRNPRFEIFEADQFFTSEDGSYQFDPEQIRDAHKDCQERTARCLNNGGFAIVSNTSCQPFERKPYLKMVPNQEIIVHFAQGRFTSIHHVPEEIILRQEKNLVMFSDSELLD